MSAPNRKGIGLGDALLVWFAIGFIVIFGGGTYAAAHLGSWMAASTHPPQHPIDLIAGLVKGRVPWPAQSTVAAALMAGVVLVLTVVVLVAWRKGASKRARVDKAARTAGISGGDHPLERRGAAPGRGQRVSAQRRDGDGGHRNTNDNHHRMWSADRARPGNW